MEKTARISFPEGILSNLIMGLSLGCLCKAAKLGEMILDLEAQMERNPESVKIEEISDKRSELLTLESIVQGQLPIIDNIISSDSHSNLLDSTLEYLRWAAANLKSADKKLEWLEHRIEVVRSYIDMQAQDRTNRRLGRLTVLSMIFTMERPDRRHLLGQYRHTSTTNSKMESGLHLTAHITGADILRLTGYRAMTCKKIYEWA